MKLTRLGSNQTEIEAPAFRILFSYRTPVAFYDKEARCYYVTDTKWGRTTSRHINAWVGDGGPVKTVPQALVDGVADDGGREALAMRLGAEKLEGR